jgi:hypothetical protein
MSGDSCTTSSPPRSPVSAGLLVAGASVIVALAIEVEV